MATVVRPLVTAGDFAKWTGEGTVELVRGEIVEMPLPGLRHGIVSNNIQYLLTTWTRGSGSTHVVIAEAGLLTESNPDTVRGPDVMLVERSHLAAPETVGGFLRQPPVLCVEVLSPNDRWKDSIAKVDEYLQAGVREVWVIDPELRQLFIYHPDSAPQTLLGAETIVTSPLLPGFQPWLHDFFLNLAN